MVAAILLMVAFADNAAIFHNNASHQRVWAHTPQPIGSQLKAAPHILCIVSIVHQYCIILFLQNKMQKYNFFRLSHYIRLKKQIIIEKDVIYVV